MAVQGSGARRTVQTLASGIWSDVAAAVLLGMATFSKPLNFLLIGPPVLLLWMRRRFVAGLVVGMVFGVTVAGLFGVNALSSGEFNYQGGDRRTFYSHVSVRFAGAHLGATGRRRARASR